MKRLIFSILAAVCVTLGLFYFMAVLVQTDGLEKPSTDKENFIDFVRVKRQSTSEVRKREIPKKPPPPQKPPPIPKLAVSNSNAKSAPSDIKMNMPKIDSGLSFGNGPYLGAVDSGGTDQGQQSAELTPLVRIEPRYPRKAAIKGIEGWVKLKFDVTTKGTVENVEVLDSNPKRIFDQAARQALLKWKYQPKKVDGKLEIVPGQQVTIQFKLGGS